MLIAKMRVLLWTVSLGVLIFATAGFVVGASVKGAVEPTYPARDLAETARPALEPGESAVVYDDVGLVQCIIDRQENGGGAACGSTSSTEPLLSMTESVDGSTWLAVLDPTGRTTEVEVRIGATSETLVGGGDQLIQGTFPKIPDAVLLIDVDKQLVRSFQPAAADERS